MKAKLLIVGIILILIQSSTVAITRNIQKRDYEVIVRTSEGTVRAWVSGKNTKIRLKRDRDYCGYYLNGLFCKQGELEGKPLNGKFGLYDSKENILESGNYKFGLKDGFWKKLSSGGALIETNEYRKGMLNGERVIYKNGKPDVVEKYRNGNLRGKPKCLNTKIVKEKDKNSKMKKLLNSLTKYLHHSHLEAHS